MSIVKLLKLLEKEGCLILGAEMQVMTNPEKEKFKPNDNTKDDYIIPYWNLKIQLPVDKKDLSE